MSLIARLRLFVLFGSPLIAAALIILPHPPDIPSAAWTVAIVGSLMALWWATEVVPLAITALLPLIAFPLLGVVSVEDTAANYAHPLIFLFLGGFILSRGMQRWGLHRRIAMGVIRIGGKRPANIIGSLMAATAFLSLWISNTATAMVMLPIGQSVAGSSQETWADASEEERTGYGAALMLGIAYAATIGGMGSLIGTPPNALFAGYMKDAFGIEIGFAQWMLVGLPVVFVLLPLTWWLLTRMMFPIPHAHAAAGAENPDHHGSMLGPMSSGERRIAVLMVAVALLWMTRPLINRLVPGLGLSDPAIAILGAALLFVIPADLKQREFLLRWDDAARIRWDILILFGGGLALAAAIGSSGLANRIGEAAAAWQHLPLVLLVAAVTVIIVYLGELASNTAMAAVFLPVAGAVAVGMGENPLSLVLPIALAASLGFMLPVATPPNAIVFGSGAVTMQQMLRAGAMLDVIGIAVVLVIGSLIGPLVFPAGPG
jgi:sodium-dependent dicarboxylate transporter 2/3/5